MKRAIMAGAGLFVGLTLGMSLPAFVYLYNERPPVAYQRREIINPVGPSRLPEVQAGQKVSVQIEADIIQNGCHGKVARWLDLSDGQRIDYAPEQRPHKSSFVVALTVPFTATPGPAQLNSKISWSCNFVQDAFPRVVELRPLKFFINISPAQRQFYSEQGIVPAPKPPGQ